MVSVGAGKRRLRGEAVWASIPGDVSGTEKSHEIAATEASCIHLSWSLHSHKLNTHPNMLKERAGEL